MTRYRPSASPHLLRASSDRWLFGYADIMTLLLACFVSLYAGVLAPQAPEAAGSGDQSAATSDEGVGSSVVAAEHTPSTGDVLSEVVESSAARAEMTELEAGLRALVGAAPAPLGVELSSNDRGLVISVPEAGSFPPGRADLSAAARVVILGLAGELRERPNAIRVEGHTDDTPIRTDRFASNWELSTARATSVVSYLIEEAGLEPDRLSAAGYAEYRPVVDNDTPAHRARNRRVDIVVLGSPHASAGPGFPDRP